MALMFPTVGIVLNVSSVAVLWLGADRIASGSHVGRLADRLPQLPHADPDGRDDGDVHGHARRRGPRSPPSASRRCSTPSRRSCRRPARSPTVRARGERRAARRRLPLPRRRRAGAAPTSRSRSLPGKTTAIIGSTGSGKTTLLNLVPRLFDVTVRRGARRRRRRPRARPRGALAAASASSPRSPYLFSGTVASNLRYGKPDATDDELWEALDDRPGGRLRRRHARRARRPRSRRAARTCPAASASAWRSPGRSSASRRSTSSTTRSPRSTSPPTPACAPPSRPHTADATVIVVAQRVSTIVTADQILVLEDGDAVGLGTHDELLATCPTYAEIVESQLTGEDAA